MKTLEERITKAIWKHTAKDWLEISRVDIVIVGAGPAGMTAAKYLADKGFKVVIFERRLGFGGGIGGGSGYGAPKGGIGICCSVIGGMPCIVMGVVYGSVSSIGGIAIGGIDMGMFWY